jgi:hypothetical protein
MIVSNSYYIKIGWDNMFVHISDAHVDVVADVVIGDICICIMRLSLLSI